MRWHEVTGRGVLERVQPVTWVLPILLVSLVYILDVRYFSTPPLYMDDWVQVAQQIFCKLQLADWSNRRPFLLAPLAVLTPLLGIKLQYYYLANFLVIFSSGILLYIIVRRAFPRFPWLSLPVALVYLIYPVDYTRTWMTMLTYHFVFLTDLIILLLMMEYAKSGRRWQLLLAPPLFICSLGVTEGGLGIVTLGSILLACVTRNVPIRRRLGLLSVSLTAVVFVVWRTAVQQGLMHVRDNYYAQLDISIATLVSRYVVGFLVFIYGWIGPLFGSLGSTKYAILAAAGVALTGVLLVFLVWSIRRARSDDSFDWVDRKRMVRYLLLVSLIGLLFWAAGFVPVIGLRQPCFAGGDTRDNLAAIAGASLALVAGLACLAALKAGSIDRVRILTRVGVIPLLVLGLFYQCWSQNERFKAWGEQRKLWNLMFETVPGLTDNSIVIIVTPGFSGARQFQIPPFSARWEAGGALKMLYNNPSLNATYYFPDLPHQGANLLEDSVEWSQYVLVYYDPAKPSLEIVERPEERLALPYRFAGYSPDKRIVAQSPQSQAYRWLVKQTAAGSSKATAEGTDRFVGSAPLALFLADQGLRTTDQTTKDAPQPQP
jgi:hypothetical protein